jgi:hypothetical protein
MIILFDFSSMSCMEEGHNRLYFGAMTTFGLVVLLLEEPEVPRVAGGRVRAGCGQVHGLVQGDRLCRLPVITFGYWDTCRLSLVGLTGTSQRLILTPGRHPPPPSSNLDSLCGCLQFSSVFFVGHFETVHCHTIGFVSPFN